MERESIEKSYSQTYQMEEYQPAKSAVTQVVTLEEGDDKDEVADQLHEENVRMVSRDIAARIAAYEMEDGLVELLEGESDE